MSQREIKLWLIDIRDAVDHIKSFVEGLDFGAFDANAVVKHAVLHNLMIIGEAVSKLPESIKEKYPTIPWREVKGFRNYVVHEYFGLDADIIWQIIQADLTPLRDEISRIINSEVID